MRDPHTRAHAVRHGHWCGIGWLQLQLAIRVGFSFSCQFGPSYRRDLSSRRGSSPRFGSNSWFGSSSLRGFSSRSGSRLGRSFGLRRGSGSRPQHTHTRPAHAHSRRVRMSACSEAYSTRARPAHAHTWCSMDIRVASVGFSFGSQSGMGVGTSIGVGTSMGVKLGWRPPTRSSEREQVCAGADAVDLRRREHEQRASKRDGDAWLAASYRAIGNRRHLLASCRSFARAAGGAHGLGEHGSASTWFQLGFWVSTWFRHSGWDG